jgi:enamine deaminase RidA (YjgF/YER057c/UK114 family)
MQGVDPATDSLVQDPQARVVQAFRNLKLIAESEGAGLKDCVRLTVYVSDLHRYAPMVDKAQAELWGGPPYPPRTMVEVQRLFDDEIVEVDSVFYAPVGPAPALPKGPSPARLLDAGQGCSASTITKILGLCPLCPLRY